MATRGRPKEKVLSRTEMQNLVMRKVKSGMTYRDAYREVGKLIGYLKKQEANRKEPKKDISKDFKQDFNKLIYGERNE